MNQTIMNAKGSILTLTAILSMVVACVLLCGCAYFQPQQTAMPEEGGILLIKVNPEIAVVYDKDGKVVAVEGRNDDGRNLITDDAEFEGKSCNEVVTAIIGKIKDAGYIVEEAEADGNQITIEVEDGSRVPSENFLSGIVYGVYEYADGQKVPVNVAVAGQSAYGWTNYGDSDYGPENDGATDYGEIKAAAEAAAAAEATQAPAASSGGGNSNYGNTNYGNSSYNNSSYGGSTAAPAPAPAPSTGGGGDGGNSNYGNSNSGNSNSGNSNYGNSNSGNSGNGNSGNGNSNY